MKEVNIYIDGACSGNPGPGGWGAVLLYQGYRKEISGFESCTTNNRAELIAAISSLYLLKESCTVRIHTDSRYVQEGITSYADKWLKNGWRKSNGEPVKNQDLWLALLDISRKHDISWHWVKAHNGNSENERADRLAKAAIEDGLKKNM